MSVRCWLQFTGQLFDFQPESELRKPEEMIQLGEWVAAMEAKRMANTFVATAQSRDNKIYGLSKGPLLSLCNVHLCPTGEFSFVLHFFLSILLSSFSATNEIEGDKLKSTELRIIYSLKKKTTRKKRGSSICASSLRFYCFSLSFYASHFVAALDSPRHRVKTNSPNHFFQPCALRSVCSPISVQNSISAHWIRLQSPLATRSLINRNEFDLQIVVRANTKFVFFFKLKNKLHDERKCCSVKKEEEKKLWIECGIKSTNRLAKP